MRYNLKNFPDVHHFDVESCAKMHRWKEGFERELREKLELMDKKRPLWPCRYIVCEVLGE